jgi:hypothetical protein
MREDMVGAGGWRIASPNGDGRRVISELLSSRSHRRSYTDALPLTPYRIDGKYAAASRIRSVDLWKLLQKAIK